MYPQATEATPTPRKRSWNPPKTFTGKKQERVDRKKIQAYSHFGCIKVWFGATTYHHRSERIACRVEEMNGEKLPDFQRWLFATFWNLPESNLEHQERDTNEEESCKCEKIRTCEIAKSSINGNTSLALHLPSK